MQYTTLQKRNEILKIEEIVRGKLQKFLDEKTKKQLPYYFLIDFTALQLWGNMLLDLDFFVEKVLRIV